jgi:hypothetical protein
MIFLKVFGRTIRTALTRSRWFDIPLTREESLQADKKLTITFGPSQDPEGVIMVDSIKMLVQDISITLIIFKNKSIRYRYAYDIIKD